MDTNPKTKPVTAEYIIAVYDMENFIRISRDKDAQGIFNILDTITCLTIESVKEHGLVHIKNMGDASLMVFEPGDPDNTVKALYELKVNLEDYLKEKGYKNRFSFACHIGELTMGTIGTEPFQSREVFGEAVNTTFIMEGKPFKCRFAISPQLFRKLGRETRKIFHKFTPQIVYLAD